jgi:aryl-alcohol dehydrogenase-like predicted oxidoreductase
MGNLIHGRALGNGGPDVGLMGLGCWTIGGPFWSGAGCPYPTGQPLGWGPVDDRESRRAIHCALDCGITFFDTADAYGAGHSERILGEALEGRRGEVILATKFGNTYDEDTRQLTGIDTSPSYIRGACERSLKRLRTDWIDLYQLHVSDLPATQAPEVTDCLDGLCAEGLIRFYAWSTDDPERARLIADRRNVAAVQHDLNVFQDAPAMLGLCESHGLASIDRSPLAMGFLSGKFSADSRLTTDDIRSRPPNWLPYFHAGGAAAKDWVDRLRSVTEILTSDGRTPAQGALAWIWARSACTIPIPGFRTERQVRENAAARTFPPLTDEQMREVERLLERPTRTDC